MWQVEFSVGCQCPITLTVSPRGASRRLPPRCASLRFDGRPDKGICPTGGAERGLRLNFVLTRDSPEAGQMEWRFCEKCAGDVLRRPSRQGVLSSRRRSSSLRLQLHSRPGGILSPLLANIALGVMLLPPGHDAWAVGASRASSSSSPAATTTTPSRRLSRGELRDDPRVTRHVTRTRDEVGVGREVIDHIVGGHEVVSPGTGQRGASSGRARRFADEAPVGDGEREHRRRDRVRLQRRP